MAVPVCTLASGWYRSFYKTEKSITGRRAHNQIHPGGCHRRCSSLFCGETNRPCRVDMIRSSKMASERSTDVQAF
ncbi:TPA: hypothetical protein HMP73_20755, partial [Escherichia coli]|nr:hypothetical protein [Shigella sonnei]HAJ2478339.1 hypothetical protein [Escherichia coli]EFX5715657.1 hypothetical protein [Shigella sonnei]EFX6261607.1 hypothetical protein [Shigella sonnei]HAJ2532954.1 hypothetical protein [Escherichia coli]